VAIQRSHRLIGLIAATLLGLLAAGCRNEPEGAPRVVVIGGKPALPDGAAGPLKPPDAVLLQNVAQGLVAFDAGGNIVAGVAERWNVSNDGLSYIFRIAPATWPNGRKITAEQVARALRRQLRSGGRNGVRDALGAVTEVVAMTERVIEIRVANARPNLLSLLAQPEMAIVRNGVGSGPFTIATQAPKDADRLLARRIEDLDEGTVEEEQVLLSGREAEQAIADFQAGKADLVLGGTFADLPLARDVTRPRDALRFDPVSGLFGLAPVRRDGRFANVEWRRLLNQAIDRDALIAALGVPGLAPRSTLLVAGLDGVPAPAAPDWSGRPLGERRPELAAVAARLLDGDNEVPIKVWIPKGPGGDLVLRQLALDWSVLGLRAERAESRASADFELIDEVAPSASPAWFARRFRCAVAAACDPEIDELLAGARAASVPIQRYALIAQASARIDEQVLFMPIAAPIRWSLVGNRIKSFAPNRYARHILTNLDGDAADSE
jgi:peptide/nickel transport system substrate-binding protein